MTNHQPLKLNNNLCFDFRDVFARKYHKRIWNFSEDFAYCGHCWAKASTSVSAPSGPLRAFFRDTGGAIQLF